MSSQVELLPVELLDLVISPLGLLDQASFRLASRQIYAKTLSKFSKVYFSRARTSLSLPSLLRLEGITSRAYLAESVTALDIKLLDQSDYQTLRKISNVGIYPPPKRFPKIPRVDYRNLGAEIKIFDDVLDGASMDRTVALFSRILKRLSSLKTIQLRVRVLPTEAGYKERTPEDLEFHARCFTILLESLVKSGVRLQELRLPKGKPFPMASHFAGISYLTFNMSMARYQSLSDALSSLKSLALCINTQYKENARVPGWENGVSHFISSAASVQDLSLNLDSWSPVGYSAAIMASLSRSTQLSNLRTFKLYGSKVNGQDLLLFLRNHAASLHHVTLAHIDLFDALWRDQLASFKTYLALKSLQLMGIRQGQSPVFFPWRPLRKRDFVTISTKKRSEKRTMQELMDQAIYGYVVGYDALADALALVTNERGSSGS
ncbi:hypothetical protein BS50DRAFT_347816 [Corynespora cassiicola Philippines]|uniref:F-box domain-containing protein n=1 Tax=Corynespora cassiicola Philippines TaxID=1448308 RepID=A0A2T2NQL6_CORCC|nr:hypothetical protein BS50DRAFT_347816 [Corynespora cassiicola Philippines]